MLLVVTVRMIGRSIIEPLVTMVHIVLIETGSLKEWLVALNA